jgi:hypothetical protein
MKQQLHSRGALRCTGCDARELVAVAGAASWLHSRGALRCTGYDARELVAVAGAANWLQLQAQTVPCF